MIRRSFLRRAVLRDKLALLGGVLWGLGVGSSNAAPNAALRFEVRLAPSLTNPPSAGRLFVMLGITNSPEPRFVLAEAGIDAPETLAADVHDFNPGAVKSLDWSVCAYPLEPSSIPPGEYYVQALLDATTDLRRLNGPGNLYSECIRTRIDPAQPGSVCLILAKQVPPEHVPPETEQVKFITIQSKRLTEFRGHPVFLRAGVLLPDGYDREPSRRYPLWVRIGGLNTRYTVVNRFLTPRSEFAEAWHADGAPRFILLQLDGAGPYGDPYYINSANNGPYGDALVRELIPEVEKTFRAVGQPHARVLSGGSTGGWVCLALQVFYPDSFNGAWAACPDPVDFRSFQLMNIYLDTNAFVNAYGNERPSERDLEGDVVLTMRREVGLENLLGPGDSYTRSGQQWGAWNAAFGPRGADGLPAPLWDAQTGKIDHAVAHQWEKYDLRFVLLRNWKELGPKLRGKLHIASGLADQYFLNNAVHLLEESTATLDPPLDVSIVYGPSKPHGWSNLPLRQQLTEMGAAVQAGKR